jgi:hypothetical protein
MVVEPTRARLVRLYGPRVQTIALPILGSTPVANSLLGPAVNGDPGPPSAASLLHV